MREIKFRKWDSILVDPEDENNEERKFVMDYFDLTGGGQWIECRFENEAVMQFTGLKDKNGKEIYEGDIVRLTGNKTNHKVFFDNGSFMIKMGKINVLLWSILGEVIGNIYENPELLNKKSGK